MVYFQNQIFIQRPPEAVFAFLTTFENLSRWDERVRVVNHLTEGIDGVGAIYHQEGVDGVQQFRVVEFRRDERVIIVEMLPPAQALSVMLSVEAQGSGTQVTEGRELFTGSNPVADWFTRRRLKARSAKGLRRLKQVLEGEG